MKKLITILLICASLQSSAADDLGDAIGAHFKNVGSEISLLPLMYAGVIATGIISAASVAGIIVYKKFVNKDENKELNQKEEEIQTELDDLFELN